MYTNALTQQTGTHYIHMHTIDTDTHTHTHAHTHTDTHLQLTNSGLPVSQLGQW